MKLPSLIHSHPRNPWLKILVLVPAFLLSLAVSGPAADSTGKDQSILDSDTGKNLHWKLSDLGDTDDRKAPYVHLDSALDLTGSTVTLNLTNVTGLPGATPTPSPASALMVQGYTTGGPIPITEKKYASTTKLAPNYSASHITTKTTTTPTSSTCYVSAIAICVTGAGTTQTLTIQNKEVTPKTLYTAGAAIAVGNTYITFPEPVLMTSGVDIVTGGTTAGTQDVFITYWQ